MSSKDQQNPSLIATGDESTPYEQSYNHQTNNSSSHNNKLKGVFGGGDGSDESSSAREKQLNATRIPESGGMVMGMGAGSLMGDLGMGGEQRSGGGNQQKSGTNSDESARSAQGYGKGKEGEMREDVGA